MTNSPELKPDIARQATASFRGYAYQAYQTVLAWLTLKDNEELYAEFAEDIDLIKRDSEGSINKVELNQIKHEQQNLTLNSDSATELLNNFINHKLQNPDIKIHIRLCTISDRGKERNGYWIFAESGLDLWDIIKNRELTPINQEKALGIIRSFLLENNKLSQETKDFINQTNDEQFLISFIDCISWDTGQQAYGKIEDSIKEILAKRPRAVTDSSEVRQVIDRLWRYVTDTIANDPKRYFNKDDREKILSEETSVAADRSIIKELLQNSDETKKSVAKIEDNFSIFIRDYFQSKHPVVHPIEVIVPATIERYDRLPPLPKFCSNRGTIIDTISAQSQHNKLIWLFGSTGYGKTTLANLFIRKQSRLFFWFRLRGYSDYILIAAIEAIKHILFELDLINFIVVMDDLQVKANNTFVIEQLLELYDHLRSNNSQLIITSQLAPSTNLKNVLGQEIYFFDVPEMSKEEIALLLSKLSITEVKIKFWSSYIFTMTSGHPQLVNAYLTYGGEINWNLSQEEFFGKPRSVEEVKAESRKLLVEVIKSVEARELVRRLSLIPGFFNRDFALDVGIADPSLKEPGQAFDALVGPWIEAEDEGYYRLSPLLSGYAEADLGANNLLNYHKMIASAFLKQKSLNLIQINQIFFTSIMAEEELPIMKICNTLLYMNRDKFEIISKEIALVRFFYIDTPARPDWMNPFTKLIFRIIQLKISESTKDFHQYLKIDGVTLGELDNYRGMEFFNELLFMYYFKTCAMFQSSIPVQDRLTRSLYLIEMVKNRLIDNKFCNISDTLVNISTLFWFITADVENLNDLECLLDLLKKQPPEIISELINGFNQDPETFSLFIDRIWLSESSEKTPKWESCERLFSEIISFTKNNKMEWLMASAARGRMVILDEYLDKPEKALEIAKEIRTSLGNSHPLIDIGESMIYYRHDNFQQALELIEKLEEILPPEILSISRLHSIRRGIICASKLEMWDKIISLGKRGQIIGKNVKLEFLGQLAEIAFKAEVAWAYHEKGEIATAAEIFEQVLLESENFPNQQYPLFHIFFLRLGHTIGWIGELKWHTKYLSTIKEPEKEYIKPFPGIFSNLEDPPEESQNFQIPPYTISWSLIAIYSSINGNYELVKRCATRAMEKRDQGQYTLALIKAWEALFIKELFEENFEQALYSGLQFTRFSALDLTLRSLPGGGQGAFAPVDIDKKLAEVGPKMLNSWIDFITFSILEPMLMAILVSKDPLSINFPKLKFIIEKEVGKIDKLEIAIDLIETIIMATFGNEIAINNINKINKENLSSDLDRLLFIGNCASIYLSLANILSHQASMLIKIASSPVNYTIWIILFYRLISWRWLYLVKEQSFLLSAPRYSIPEIINYCSLKNYDLSDCAKLLILVSSSIGLTIPAEMLIDIKKCIYN